jgi:sarcosine oxidase subunit beta
MTTGAITFAEALPATAELVIIGGGVIGAATADAARRAGLEPLVLEARPMLASATTAVATGAYRLQQDDPDELVLVRETLAAMRDFATYTGQTRYDPACVANGRVVVTTTEEGAAGQRETAAHHASLGVDGIELLDGEEARRRFTFLTPAVRQVRFRADEGMMDPKRLALGLLAGSRAPVVNRCRALGFDVTGGVLAGVRTSRGTVSTRSCVIAAGPLSGVVAATAGVDLPVRTLRRHRLVLPDVPQVPPDAPLVYDEDTGAHWRPAFRGAYALLSEPDNTDVDAVDDPLVDPGFPYRLLDPASPTSLARTTSFWREVWDDGRAAWASQCGLYTVTPDFRPLLDETPVTGLYVNTGYSGHGVMCSVGGARHLLEVVTGSRRENPFALDRTFVEPRSALH